ncbi:MULTISPECIES: phage terminase large subunit family protein [Deinococcus]|uniref:Phage terminase large subunit family protein n=1 Tax=Deinococcus multiflagellatus TaxID=1656887 RepID=A0ABW1ZFV8_9DEIO|nr:MULTISPECIES: phage terminase large subunit family protein [Deinococcus]MBZ9711789.1 phage terminase large subunit family protein [Deinococcus multiflagellatus]
MAILEVECPICEEVLELTDEDRAELAVGDVIVCASCHSEMEVTRNGGGEDFELDLLSAMTTCPHCDEEFEVTPDMLAAAPATRSQDGTEVSLMTCPHCKSKFELDLSDEPE